jgi:serine/threonine-protein kinase PBS1
VQLADPVLRGQFSESVLKKAVDVAILCLQENANNRPSMQDVVAAMNFLVSCRYCPNKANKAAIKATEDNSPNETKMLDKGLDREKAVAEARMWGETWRDKQRQTSHTAASDGLYAHS